MTEDSSFSAGSSEEISSMSLDKELQTASMNWMNLSVASKYSYQFSFLGRPVIQYPQDMIAVQELIWEIKPDLIIETGIAHGGSLIYSASMLALLDLCELNEENELYDKSKSKRKVVGIDIDIRRHNRIAIENHPLSKLVEIIEGSSIDPKVVNSVKEISKNYSKIMVLLDSNHTYEHVFQELIAYAPLVTLNSYCIVFDTIVEDLPTHLFGNRPWGPGNNPKTAVREFLKINSEFEIDEKIHDKLKITVAPEGYLKRFKL
jgi:cephalosporin hydroxylase